MRISDWSSDVCSSDLRPPEAEPRGVAQILRLGGAGRGDVDDPGARQCDLQSDPGEALFGPLGRAKLGLRAGGVAERMRFVEQNDAVDIRPRPVETLLQARSAVMTPGAKRRQGEEDDPARHTAWATQRQSNNRQ